MRQARFAVVTTSLVSLSVCGFAPSIACSSSDSNPGVTPDGGEGDAATTTPSTPTARFALSGDSPPAFLDVPFPSDAYISPATARIVDPIPGMDAVIPKGAEYMTHELGKLRGFSRVAMAMFPVDDPSGKALKDETVAHAEIDPGALPIDEDACVKDSSSVYFIDLEADASHARIPCRSFFHDDAHNQSKVRPVVSVGPARGIVLEEGHRYAAVLTSRLKTKDGRAIGANPEFSILAASASSPGESDEHPIVAMYKNAIAASRTALASALATDGATIVSIAPYTTNSQTKELFRLRETLEDEPVPPLVWDAATVAPMKPARFTRKVDGALPSGFDASLDDWLGVVAPQDKLADQTDDPSSTLPVRAHDKIATVGTAVFIANDYLQHKEGGYPTPDHATFAYDAAGNIVKSPDSPTQKIWVTIVVPTAPMPATGYPTVIVQHGLSDSRAYLLSLANVLAAKGWMSVAIDSITFGARAAAEAFHHDDHTDYEVAPGATYKGGDGIADPDANGARNGSSDLFGGLQNIGAIRDQIREAAIDTSQLVRVLRANPDLTPLQTFDAAPKIDPDRIAFLGDSLGAVEGIAAAAIEPNVKTFFFNVVGAGLFTELAARSPTISSPLSLAAGFFFGLSGARLSESHPLVNLCESIVDGGDPISYAGFLLKHPGSIKGKTVGPKNILTTQVLFDEVVSNRGQ